MPSCSCLLSVLKSRWLYSHSVAFRCCDGKLSRVAGYFALNVPSGLALYWFVNNILSTGQQAWLKSTYADASSLPGASTMAAADKAEEERQERVKQLTGEVCCHTLSAMDRSSLQTHCGRCLSFVCGLPYMCKSVPAAPRLRLC